MAAIMIPPSSPQRRFRVALSFAGEHRPVLQQIAVALAATLSEGAILYDHFHKLDFARLDLDTYLPNLYRTHSDLILVFLCPQYQTKRWCRLEWRYIRNLIATDADNRIRFLSFGDPGDLSHIGILPGDGWWDISKVPPSEVAGSILHYIDHATAVTPLGKRSAESVVSPNLIRAYLERVQSSVSRTIVPGANDKDPRYEAFHDWCIPGKVVPSSRLLSEDGSAPVPPTTVDEMAVLITGLRVGHALFGLHWKT